jgi:pimeloyl-ACP methyl ester carboxylesterase
MPNLDPGPGPSVRAMKYEIAGDAGDPVVLVPGGLTGWLSWKPHAERLARTRRVVRVQLLPVELGLTGVLTTPEEIPGTTARLTRPSE